MSDFITLQCPNCGGKLEIGANTVSLQCQHCGMEHMVRKGVDGVMLEAYARCPVCNRNDRAEKVSAILRSQTQSIKGTTYQKQTSIQQVGDTYQTITEEVAIPVESSQMSELARHLAAPPAPAAIRQAPVISANPTHVTIVSVILLILFGLGSFVCAAVSAIWAISSSTNNETITFAILAVLLVVVAIALVVAGILTMRFVHPKEREKNAKKKAAAEKMQRDFQSHEQGVQEQWKRAMKRWNELYYCGRDDCVFLPGTNSFAPISDLIDYLYQS